MPLFIGENVYPIFAQFTPLGSVTAPPGVPRNATEGAMWYDNNAKSFKGLINGIASSIGGSSTPTYPVTVAGTVNSGGIPCFTNATTESSSAAISAGALISGGGVGACAGSSGIVASGGQFTTVNGQTALTGTGQGFGGVPVELYATASSQFTANAGPTTIIGSTSCNGCGGGPAGILFVAFRQTQAGTSCTGATSFTFNVTWTNGNGTFTVPVGTVTTAANNGVVGTPFVLPPVLTHSGLGNSITHSITNFTAGTGCVTIPGFVVEPMYLQF